MPMVHSLVPAIETKSFHTVIRDEGHPEVAGIGVECGGRHPPTYSARSQVRGNRGSDHKASQNGACLGPAVLFPQTCDNVVKKGKFISLVALIFLAPAYLSLQRLFTGKEVGAPFYRSGKCG